MRAHELCKLCSSFVINFSELGYWYWITVCIAGRWNKLLRSKTINSYNNIYIYIYIYMWMLHKYTYICIYTIHMLYCDCDSLAFGLSIFRSDYISLHA